MDLLQAVTLLSTAQLQFFSQRKPTGLCPSLQVEVIPLAAVRLMPCSPCRLEGLCKRPTLAPEGPGGPFKHQNLDQSENVQDAKRSTLNNTHKDY